MVKKRSLGPAFSDEMTKVSVKNTHFKSASWRSEEIEWADVLLPNIHFGGRVDKSRWRGTTLLIVSVILFFALFLRLFHLQVVYGEKNRELAEGNRIKIKVAHAPRGVIYDRNGQVLASNSPGFRLFDSPGGEAGPSSKSSRFLSREEALEMEVKDDPRVANLEVDSIRTYPQGFQLAHVIGYVGEISEDQLKGLENRYLLGDRIGQSGVEAYYEHELKGVDGGEIIEVDSKGQTLRTLRNIPPIAGKNLYLNIDVELQRQVFQALENGVKKAGSCCGAAVAQDPNTGQILALASYPSFDNNILSLGQDGDIISSILSAMDSPVLNRSLGGTYPPGSTFKIITSLAALASGKITPASSFEDTGEIYLGTFRFTNWYFTQYGKTEGSVDLVKALKRSNDTYFYRVGQTIGEDLIQQWSRKLRLGGELGIDLPGEVAGLVPDENWKKTNFGQIWYPGDTLHLAIGQGFILTTPLQINGATSFIAANGSLYRPQLFLKTTSSDGATIDEFKSETLISNIISKEYINVIRRGLEEVPKGGGTAWPFFTFPIASAGKTGTAEFGDPKGRTHAWYTSYAPADDPKIVLTVLVEGGGEGSSVAGPVVKEVFRWYFSEDKNNLLKDTYQVATESARRLGE